MTHTVVLVEDEEELREMMREALEEDGFTVVAACEGQEALDAIERTKNVSLILLDLMMPGMNGWDFFAAFKARPEFQGIPVVVHSSAPNRAPAGVTRVLQKPLKLERLLAIVHELCRRE